MTDLGLATGSCCCGRVLPAHLRREFLDFGQVALHFAPTIPERIIWAGVEGTLESAHAMLEEHDEQLLLGHGGGIMKSEQIRERVWVVRGFREDTVLVEVLQPTPTLECLLSFQSLTTLGVTLVWHSTHFASSEPRAAGAAKSPAASSAADKTQ